MRHQTTYKLISHYCSEQLSSDSNSYHKIDIILADVLKEYGECLADEISNQPEEFEWRVVSHSVSFLNNHPVITILLSHD